MAINQRAKQMAQDFMKVLRRLRENQNNEDVCLNILRQAKSLHNSEIFSKGIEISKLISLSFDKVFLIHKFLESPMDILVDGMSAKKEEDVKKYYRTIAKQLHPDKNCHPRAKEAFQKIKNALEESRRIRYQRRGQY